MTKDLNLCIKRPILFNDSASEEEDRITDAAFYFDSIPEKEDIFLSDCVHLTEKGNEYG